MSFLLFSIATSVITYFFTKSYVYFSLIALGIYYLKRDNLNIQKLLSLTYILIIALAFFSNIRGYEPKGILILLIACFLSILYDIFKNAIWSIPFFTALGISISMIGSIKYGNIGYLFGLLVIPIFLREFKRNNRRGEKN